MIFQRRSSKVLTNPNQLCQGFSGAMTEDDIRRSFQRSRYQRRLQDVHVFRELTEELGIRKHSVAERCFMGLSRELLRGGKPELFLPLILICPPKRYLNVFRKNGKARLFLCHFAMRSASG
jgi:hypothetical protein